MIDRRSEIFTTGVYVFLWGSGKGNFRRDTGSGLINNVLRRK
jgi:hypothetical protein